MAEFIEADQEWLKKVLEPYESTVDKKAEETMRRLSSQNCPSCGAAMYPALEAPHITTEGSLSHKYLLHCTYCKTIIEPDTGIIVKSGEAYEPLPTIADLFTAESDQ